MADGELTVREKIIQAHDMIEQTSKETSSLSKKLIVLLETLDELCLKRYGTTNGYPLVVKSLTGKKINLKVNVWTTVLELMSMVQASEGIPIEQQRLIFGGKNLRTEFTMSDYNIQRDSELTLVLRLRGGMYDITSAKMDLLICTQSDLDYYDYCQGMLEDRQQIKKCLEDKIASLEKEIEEMEKNDQKTD